MLRTAQRLLLPLRTSHGSVKQNTETTLPYSGFVQAHWHIYAQRE